MAMALDPAGRTLFYDGDCGFCHGGVRWLAQHDRAGVLRFAPIGGVRWQSCALHTTVDSVVLWDRVRGVQWRWAAVRQCCLDVGGWPRGAGYLMYLVPLWIGDRIYDLIARHRRRMIAAASGPCPLLSAQLRPRFADVPVV